MCFGRLPRDEVLALPLEVPVVRRVPSYRGAMPKPEEYVEAFRALLPTLAKSVRSMLEANYHAPDRARTPDQLRQAAGYANLAAVNLRYGRVGARVGDALDFRPTKLSLHGKECKTFAIADWERGRWVLLPEVVAALRMLGW